MMLMMLALTVVGVMSQTTSATSAYEFERYEDLHRPPPAPANLNYTCSPGQPGANLPFCDRSLGFKARAADLSQRLNLSEHVALFFSYPSTPSIERLNVKSWSLDHTCIHGINKQSGVTVFPHAIAQGASFDLDLVTRISNATAIEARIYTNKVYQSTGGHNAGAALSCDGGPLANSAHDPRWGRISETYGEDPVHIQIMGVSVMQGLQNPLPVPGSKDDDDKFFATRQVTRHYIGYHSGSGDTINGTNHDAWYNATKRSLADSYFPTFGAFQRPDLGFADGIMCAMTELNGVPSCANPYLMTTMLRETWNSDAIIQSDCCDSIGTISQFKYKNASKQDALVMSVNDGLGNYFGFDVTDMKNYMAWALGNGTVTPQTMISAGQRVLLSFFRLGFFDNHAADYPYHNNSMNWDMLDSAAHRALSREATAKSTVLLRNDGTLPLQSSQSVAVIGPFAQCVEPAGSHTQNGTCYLHSYNGNPSSITNIYQGIKNRSASATFAQGSNFTCGWRCGWKHGMPPAPCWTAPGPAMDAISEAVAAASKADVTVLALGLGADVEAEGCDRFNLTLPAVQQVLLSSVAKVAKKLVVVVVSAGGVDLDESLANAVLWAPYGGEEAGSGLADIIYGQVNPSAKLPVTFYHQKWFDAMTDNITTSMLNLNLEVGLGRTHRYIEDHSNVIHWFGFGLSYTKFTYSNLDVRKITGGLQISVSVMNAGQRTGAEVVQVYISGAKVKNQVTPKISLIGFNKIDIVSGRTSMVEIMINSTRLETAMDDGTTTVVAGTYTVWACGHHPFDTTSDPISTTSDPISTKENNCVASTITL